jgi:RimJ/RimL family protein N-acetyltransferase
MSDPKREGPASGGGWSKRSSKLRVELIQLSVVRENEPARRLYGGLGFVEYGFEIHALKQGGRYYDEILMAMDLT